ncbi:hypothetical protein ACFPOI_14370 [Nonomuraea angiospora]|uniref:WXG100 family type VII secretion target n=2 Tax=Nonomuraea angiospora TaxID=46172 RepID=A0ABR9MFP7_9ACTN|nr:hypothetical protein [Nonomuraea angiospora]MBE1591727.1 hypothetical protein [Nonomuraea angiospora]
MTDYWTDALKDTRAPQIDDIAPTGNGDSDSSDGVAALIQGTNPGRVADAGKRYKEIAEMCAESVELLHNQAGRIAETLGGESLQKIFETVGELQRDLARISIAADSVGVPLEWYGAQVLPWFHNNVPRTGSVGLDDDIGDAFGSDTNGHALARHHLRQLNRFMGEVYGAIAGYVEQRSSAPQAGLTDPSLPLGPKLPSSLTGDPYAGTGPGSPYGTPRLDTPALQNPSLQDPSLQDPSLQNPSLQNPSLQDPSLQSPSLQNPSLKDPSLQTPQTPDLKDPSLQNPDLKNPELNTPKLPETPRTDLAAVPPQPSLPQTNLPPGPTTGQPTGNGPGTLPGTVPATQLSGSGSPASGAGRLGATGMGMGMIPPMMGGGQNGSERDRDRARFPLVEDEAFETDDMGGPSVIA